jgi:hypothetical protein
MELGIPKHPEHILVPNQHHIQQVSGATIVWSEQGDKLATYIQLLPMICM